MAKGIEAMMLVLITCLTLFPRQTGPEPKYVIGATIVGSKSPCLFIGGVSALSPAADAGIKSGDRIIAVDGTTVTTVQDAAQRMRSESAKPVALQLVRDGKPYSVTVQRELQSAILKRNGMKMLESGMIAPLDATETEMSHKIRAINEERFVDRIFPSHYPDNENLYYPGFEVFVLNNPFQIAVGGIENGPASRAGVHWGDVITLVNGVDPRNKSVAELEALLSSQKAAPMTLTIGRDGVTKTFSFHLEQATTVLRDNQRRLNKGNPIPLGTPEEYLSCFE
jgi:C-terminal processing protease CtpA/Prc